MADKFVVVVTDTENSKQNEVTVLDSAEHAKRTIETLLEAGYEQGHLRVFAGSQVDVVATYRPVVALVSDSSEEKAPPSPEERDPSHEKEVRVEEAPTPPTVETRRERVGVGVEPDRGHAAELSDTGSPRQDPRRRFASLFRRQYEAAFETSRPRTSKVLISAAEEAA